MQLTLLPLAVLAATATAQGWGQQPPPPTAGAWQPPQPYQQPGQYQPVPPPPGGPGGSWSYQTTYNQPPTKPAQEFRTITDQEADDWRSCTNSFLQSVDRNDGGSGPACNFWECLHVQASKWGRGGVLTGVSNALNPVCSIGNAVSHIPIVGDIFKRF